MATIKDPNKTSWTHKKVLKGTYYKYTVTAYKVINGKKIVIDNKNNDVTENFVKGANEVLELAKKLNIKEAILKSRSPSCGKGQIYSGNFDGKLIDGDGVLVELLINNGIKVISSDDI